MTDWFTTKKPVTLALKLRGLQFCALAYTMTGGPGVPKAAPMTPERKPALNPQPRPVACVGRARRNSRRQTRSRKAPISRLSAVTGRVARTQTPSGLPTAEPRAHGRAHEEIDEGPGHDLAHKGDDHDDGEHQRVDREQHYRRHRRHHPRQEGHGDESDAETGESHDEARGDDDEGPDGPGDGHRSIFVAVFLAVNLPARGERGE